VKHGWSGKNIGHHIVRNNEICHCEQAGVVGSLGAIFSSITGNDIHDIHIRQLFTGAEMAGIKIHAAIDTTIQGNHIYRTVRGIWLDWMNQGARVTENLLHDNGPGADLFVEVNHGPFMVDHNFFLSKNSLRNWSQGGAYVHNLFAGQLSIHPVLNRVTPFHAAHSVKITGITKIEGGDDRFYNNLFIGKADMTPYNSSAHPVWMKGNVFFKDAKPSKHEPTPVVLKKVNLHFRLIQKKDGYYLDLTPDPSKVISPDREAAPLVTSALLGKSRVSKQPFLQPDGSPYRIDTDYFGNPHPKNSPFPGPIEIPAKGKPPFKIWNNSNR
jgi:alpha-N-arabinofuranosidase